MTLPHMTAHQNLGPTRFTRTSLSRSTGYHVTAHVTPGGYRFRLTAPNGEEAGKVVLKPMPDGRMEIYDLRVSVPHRGKQLSKKLMAQAARTARQLGGNHLWLEAHANEDDGPSNPKLYSIYEKMGFRKTIRNSQDRQEMEAPL